MTRSTGTLLHATSMLSHVISTLDEVLDLYTDAAAAAPDHHRLLEIRMQLLTEQDDLKRQVALALQHFVLTSTTGQTIDE